MTRSCQMCGQFMARSEMINGGVEWECWRCGYNLTRPHPEEVWGVETGAGRYR